MNTTHFLSAWLTNDLDEIIFEKRNKSYGAYELRKHYPRRLQSAFGITAMFCFLLFLWLRLNSTHELAGNEFWVPERPIVLDEGTWTELPSQKPEEPKSVQKDVVSLPTKVVPDSNILMHEPDTTGSQFHSQAGNSDSGDSGPSTVSRQGSGDSGSNAIDSSDAIFDRNKPVISPSVMPSFPGGQKSLARYLQNKLSCSQFRHSNEKSGKIYLSLVVSMDGTITNVEILRDGVGFGCGEEAVKVLQNMPRWNPGMNNDRPVNTKIIMPISMETTPE